MEYDHQLFSANFLLLPPIQHVTYSDVPCRQIAAQSNTFILAGYETTANTLAFSVYLLCKHPDVQRQLLAEVDAFGTDVQPSLADLERLPYTSAVVNEALRLYPPGTFVTREARQDTQVSMCLFLCPWEQTVVLGDALH
jgi:cytochrome P450